MRMRLLRLLGVSLLVSAAAFGQNNRSFVSTTGNDANNCTPGNECRSFARAISMTGYGGEIIAVSSGGYGPVVPVQAVTVAAAPGIYAAITTAGNAVTVNVSTSDRVVLKNLNIVLTGPAIGIYGTTFGSLFIDGCTVTGGQFGVFISAAPGALVATITNSVAREASNDGFAVTGICNVTLINCRAEHNGDSGLLVSDGGNVTASSFVAASNHRGVRVYVTGACYLYLDHAVISNSASDGVAAVATDVGSVAVLAVSNSTVTGNGGCGFSLSGNGVATSSFRSMGNNFVNGNLGGDVCGTIAPISGH